MTEPPSSFLAVLLGLFPGDGLSPGDMEAVPAAEVPQPYQRLLVHHHHMTVTLEAHHRSEVRLVVLDRRVQGHDYARKLILTAGPDERPVLAGMMRLQLQHCGEEVRRRILAESAPLGRILIEENVLRWIEPQAYVRVRLHGTLRALFRAPAPAVCTYGRFARIFCDNSPAVELLEIVAPEEQAR